MKAFTQEEVDKILKEMANHKGKMGLHYVPDTTKKQKERMELYKKYLLSIGFTITT